MCVGAQPASPPGLSVAASSNDGSPEWFKAMLNKAASEYSRQSSGEVGSPGRTSPDMSTPAAAAAAGATPGALSNSSKGAVSTAPGSAAMSSVRASSPSSGTTYLTTMSSVASTGSASSGSKLSPFAASFTMQSKGQPVAAADSPAKAQVPAMQQHQGGGPTSTTPAGTLVVALPGTAAGRSIPAADVAAQQATVTAASTIKAATKCGANKQSPKQSPKQRSGGSSGSNGSRGSSHSYGYSPSAGSSQRSASQIAEQQLLRAMAIVGASGASILSPKGHHHHQQQQPDSDITTMGNANQRRQRGRPSALHINKDKASAAGGRGGRGSSSSGSMNSPTVQQASYATAVLQGVGARKASA